MKKILAGILALVIMLAFIGCGKEGKEPAHKVYSISGECDEFRIINGIAVIGREQEIFYGGKLELKTDDFKNISGHSFEYYIDNGGDKHTIMNNVMINQSSTYDLYDEETGQISGTILNFNMDVSVFEHNLYFKLTVTDENGYNKDFRIPLEVKQVSGSTDTEKVNN